MNNVNTSLCLEKAFLDAYKFVTTSVRHVLPCKLRADEIYIWLKIAHLEGAICALAFAAIENDDLILATRLRDVLAHLSAYRETLLKSN